MSECKHCGRDDGHYIGCPKVTSGRPEDGATGAEAPPSADAEACAMDGCENPRRPKGKGPAPKYCTEHSDPKNRK
jgi:hypothetical protein